MHIPYFEFLRLPDSKIKKLLELSITIKKERYETQAAASLAGLVGKKSK